MEDLKKNRMEKVPITLLRVPLLFAITRRKREEEYVVIFEKMKQPLEHTNESDPQSELELAILVDYVLVPNEMKKLRRKDGVRREKIEAVIFTLEATIRGGQNPIIAEFGRYWCNMSRYTSDKAV
ncbi:hypothetical protein RB195_025333 [Necator americanus]|uniref:Uncharacterized protein n=1 Tax=Necator americanus TaxID=51031 RepID=A0ABR1ERX0_NECAM